MAGSFSAEKQPGATMTAHLANKPPVSHRHHTTFFSHSEPEVAETDSNRP
jgi:hypothetical protein